MARAMHRKMRGQPLTFDKEEIVRRQESIKAGRLGGWKAIQLGG